MHEYPRNDTDTIDLLDLFRRLRENWLILAVCVAVALVVGFIYLKVATPMYRAAAVIVEVNASARQSSGAAALLSRFGGLAGIGGLDMGSGSDIADKGLTIIRSRTFAEEFITRNDLLPVLFAEDWEKFKQPPRVSSGAGVLRNAFTLDLNRETGLITLMVEWTDAETAANWANGMVALANEIARERDIAEAERSIAYLQEQISTTNVVELQQVLYNLLESEQQTLMLASARDEYVFQVIDPALVPNSPATPRRMIVLILSLMIGGIVGLIVVYFRETIKHYRTAR